MPKSQYVYEDPCTKGYKRFSLTAKQHDEIFPARKRKWSNYYEYYISDDKVAIHCLTSIPAKMAAVLSFPIVVLFGGLGNIKEIFKEYGDLFHEKERGKFVADEMWSRSDAYQKIKNILN